MRYIDACEDCLWHLRLWSRSDPATTWVQPFTCRSWRHKGECRLWKGAQDFQRIKAALEKYTDWVFLTLTYSHRDWPIVSDLFRATLGHWSAFRKRFVRHWGRFRYVQTWESHQSGYPHVHAAIGSPSFHLACSREPQGVLKYWVEPTAVAAGFGYMARLKVCYDRAGLAGYFSKLAAELTGAGTKNQVPIDAPPHFRRLRASQGLLEPPLKDPDIAGILFFCPPGTMNVKPATEST